MKVRQLSPSDTDIAGAYFVGTYMQEALLHKLKDVRRTDLDFRRMRPSLSGSCINIQRLSPSKGGVDFPG